MEKYKILCYNVDGEAFAELKALASRLGAETVLVSAEDFGKPIAVVASGVKAVSNPLAVPSFSESMAVFVSVPDAMLDVLLSSMRKRGIKISLKAVLTPTNALWDALSLYKELCRERKEF